MTHILVTGGAGFIGSHICLKLAEAGFQPVVLDDFSNGHRDAIAVDIPFIQGDVRDRECLDRIFANHDIAAVIHMAGLIEAGVSMRDPAPFYSVNTSGSFTLFEAMRHAGISKIVFSSTAALYGDAAAELLDETLPALPVNPYGASKAMVERLLQDYTAIYGFQAFALRYFNAAGADPEGRAGERHDPESHLIPLALQAAMGQRAEMKLFGTDYPTPDGSCVRDYIHVDDLARAHMKALEYLLMADDGPIFEAVNVGTGTGASVREILDICRQVTGIEFPIIEEERRPGDPPRLVADVAKAKTVLEWQADYTDPADMIRHAWAFMQET